MKHVQRVNEEQSDGDDGDEQDDAKIARWGHGVSISRGATRIGEGLSLQTVGPEILLLPAVFFMVTGVVGLNTGQVHRRDR